VSVERRVSVLERHVSAGLERPPWDQYDAAVALIWQRLEGILVAYRDGTEVPPDPAGYREALVVFEAVRGPGEPVEIVRERLLRKLARIGERIGGEA